MAYHIKINIQRNSIFHIYISIYKFNIPNPIFIAYLLLKISYCMICFLPSQFHDKFLTFCLFINPIQNRALLFSFSLILIEKVNFIRSIFKKRLKMNIHIPLFKSEIFFFLFFQNITKT